MLILPIKRKWFDMILSGEKKEEYRDIKPYYDTRLMDAFGMIWVGDELIRAPMPELQKNRVQLVAFRNGYGKDVPTIWTECSLSAGYGREEWGAEPGKKYYILTIENIGGITMFLSTSVLNNLMKKAYKTGLVVARTQDAQGNDWLYLAGSYWEVSVNKDFIPKKTLGDIITLIGELPRPGERFKATKEGNQIEIEMPMAINEDGFGTDTLTITDVILIGTQGTAQRLLQDELTGQIYPVNNVFVSIINNAMVEEDKGEYTVTEPLFNPFRGILWKNNVCKLRAHFRTDDKNIKVLKSLKGVDITPEVPEE